MSNATQMHAKRLKFIASETVREVYRYLVEYASRLEDYHCYPDMNGVSGFVRQIMARAESLELFPYAGAVVPEINRDDIRETFIKKYRMIYQIVEQEVHILAVIHGARELPTGLVDRAS